MVKADGGQKFWWKQVNLTYTYDAALFHSINASYGNYTGRILVT